MTNEIALNGLEVLPQTAEYAAVIRLTLAALMLHQRTDLAAHDTLLN